MKNRIVENWLINSSEVAYKIPFCQLLISKGFKLVHNTRDGPFEQGKDIIAIDQKGVPCGFQLKRGDISQKMWGDIRRELEDLVEIDTIHPSILQGTPHRSFLVTNGELSEEVRREIDDKNRAWKKKGYSPLETVVKGELVADFQKYYGDFLPDDVPDLSAFLKLYQHEGREPLDKESFVKLIEGIMPISLSAEEKYFKSRLAQSINSAIVIVSYILGNKYKEENHIAIIDGWVILLAYVFAIIEKFNLPQKYWKQSVDLIWLSIESQLQALEKEVAERKHFVEGDPLADVTVYRSRISVLSGYLASSEVLKYIKDIRLSDTTKKFLDENPQKLVLLGEVMTPLLLNVALYRQIVGNDDHTRILLTILIDRILTENEAYKGKGLPDPYHPIEELLRWQYGFIEDIQGEGFAGISYSLRSIILLLAYKNMRTELEQRWLKISYLQYAEFTPEKPWQIFRWHNDNEGHFQTRFPDQTQSWKGLKNESEKDYSATLPNIVLKYPEFIPLFLCVFPHRLTPNIILFFFKKISLIRSKR